MQTRRRVAFLLVACLALLAAAQAGADEPPVRPNQAMPLGERLVYKMTWLGIPIGIGELWVKEQVQLNGRDVIHIAGMIETNKVLATIFPMHDEAHSWIDATTLESVRFEKKIDERFINAHDLMVFDAASGTGQYESVKSGKTSEFTVTAPVHDVLSAFYWVRRQALVPGTSVHTVLTADQKDWELEVKVIRREAVKLRGKSVDTIRLEPNTRVQGKEKRGLARFNLTADASRTPVRIVYKAPFGSVVGKLKQSRSSEE